MRDRTVHFDQVAGAGRTVQAVDVLRDDGLHEAAALELGDDVVRTVRLLVAQRHEALRVEVPEAVGVATERVDVRDLHRVDLLPHALAGRAEVGDPGWNRDPRPREYDGSLRARKQVRDA